MIPPIKFKGGNVLVLNQLLLPQVVKYEVCKTAADLRRRIKDMTIRGAPLLGISSAATLALAINNRKLKDVRKLIDVLEVEKQKLFKTRPTAVNLFWAAERFIVYINFLIKERKGIDEIKRLAWKFVYDLYKDDQERCAKIGLYGKELLQKDSIVMTHCNAGGLATAGYGTALGVIRAAFREGKVKKVYVTETRPYLQGARLTMFELMNDNIPCELITDNMAGFIMRTEGVNAVIVGADRIASNGDVANKIGTYQLAIVANFHRIPFYVAAPFSTIDTHISSGKEIVIEERSPDEVKMIFGKYITPKNAKARHPAFDVTPANLISAIITEKGIFRYPYNFKER